MEGHLGDIFFPPELPMFGQENEERTIWEIFFQMDPNWEQNIF